MVIFGYDIWDKISIQICPCEEGLEPWQVSKERIYFALLKGEIIEHAAANRHGDGLKHIIYTELSRYTRLQCGIRREECAKISRLDRIAVSKQ